MSDLTIHNAGHESLKLRNIAEKLHEEGIFTGGPPNLFESAGRLQLSTLVREGLYPFSKVLDIGCGCLRAGYWLVRLLDRGCYFGIEPNVAMLKAGIDHLLTPEIVESKRPSFDNNDRYDFPCSGLSSMFFWHVRFGPTPRKPISRPCLTTSCGCRVETLFS